MSNPTTYICHECGGMAESLNGLPKGWIVPKHGLIHHENIDAMKRTAPPGTVIALCSAGCFNKVASGDHE